MDRLLPVPEKTGSSLGAESSTKPDETTSIDNDNDAWDSHTQATSIISNHYAYSLLKDLFRISRTVPGAASVSRILGMLFQGQSRHLSVVSEWHLWRGGVGSEGIEASHRPATSKIATVWNHRRVQLARMHLSFSREYKSCGRSFERLVDATFASCWVRCSGLMP